MYKKILLFGIVFIAIVNLFPSKIVFASDKPATCKEMMEFYEKEIAFDTHRNDYENYSIAYGLSWLKKHGYNDVVIETCRMTGASASLTDKDAHVLVYYFIASPSLEYDKSTQYFKSVKDDVVCLELRQYVDKEDKAYNGVTQFGTSDLPSNANGFQVFYDTVDGASDVMHYQVGSIDNFDGYEVFDENSSLDDLSVGSIAFTLPQKDAYYNGFGDKKYATIDFNIVGKIPFRNTVDDVDICTSSLTKLKSVLHDKLASDITITLNGVECSISGDFSRFNIKNSITINGDVESWIKNKYYTFSMKGCFVVENSQLKNLVGTDKTSKLKATISCPVKIKNAFTKKCDMKSYTTPTRTIFITVYTDNNKDGIDDNTGIKIPDFSAVDTDGDGKPDSTFKDTDDPFDDDYFDEDGNNTSDSVKNGKGLLSFISQCIRQIGEFFEVSLNLIENAKNFMVGFPQFVQGLFACFPNSIGTFIALGLELMIIIAIIKFIRG